VRGRRRRDEWECRGRELGHRAREAELGAPRVLGAGVAEVGVEAANPEAVGERGRQDAGDEDVVHPERAPVAARARVPEERLREPPQAAQQSARRQVGQARAVGREGVEVELAAGERPLLVAAPQDARVGWKAGAHDPVLASALPLALGGQPGGAQLHEQLQVHVGVVVALEHQRVWAESCASEDPLEDGQVFEAH